MRILIVGLGVQGKKRKSTLKNHNVITADIINKFADYKCIKDVPITDYDVVFLCTPDKEKYKIIKYCIENKKHILVEKPLWFKNIKQFYSLQFRI